jgi:hypothetical protein
MTLGRPAMVAIPEADSVPLPLEVDDEYLECLDINNERQAVQPSTLSFYVLSANLFKIVQHILLSFYPGEQPNDVYNYDLYFLGPESVFHIDSELMKWCASIPNHLQLHQTKSNGVQKCDERDKLFNRQSVVLRIRYDKYHSYLPDLL